MKVADVQDTTALRNTLVEFNGTFVANDTANPSISSTDYNESARKVTLNFGREMDLATVNTKGNYYINFEKNGANAQNIALPTEVSVNAVNGGKSVVLQFPEFIDGTKVTFGPNGSVKGVVATGLKSKTGQVVSLDASSLKDAAANQLKWTNAVQKDAKTFELTFNQVVASANVSDFQIAGKYPASVSIDENKVTLKTVDEVAGQTLVTLFANNSVETYSNNKLNLSSNASMTVNNAVSPRVTEVSTREAVAGGQEFTITFTNSVGFITGTSLDAIANDIIVKDLSVTNTPALTPVADYKVTDVTGNTVTVLLTKTSSLDKPISVQVKDAKYLVANGTTTKATDSSVYTVTAPSASVTNPTVNGTTISAEVVGKKATAVGDQITLTATEATDAINAEDVVVDVEPVSATVLTGTITYNAATKTYVVADDVSVKTFVAYVNANQFADFTAVATVADDSIMVASDTATFTGGVTAKAGVLTVKLSKVVTGLANNSKVTIGNDTYDATLNATNDAIQVTLNSKDVVGEQFKATVLDGTKQVAVATTISSN